MEKKKKMWRKVSGRQGNIVFFAAVVVVAVVVLVTVDFTYVAVPISSKS